MNATDLRLNNIIKLDGEIVCLTKDVLYDILKYDWIGICEPVKITKTLLLDMGFECEIDYESEEEIYKLDNIFEVDFYSYKSFDVYIFGCHLAKPYLEEDLSLHQIQNLYYEITGKELEVKINLQ